MEEQDISFEIMTLAHMLMRYHEHQAEVVKKLGITSKMLRVLVYIHHHQQQDVYQKDLELYFKVRPPTITANLNLMAKHDLILREPVKKDGRLKRLKLTEKGEEICNEFTNIHHNVNRVFEQALTVDEQQQLCGMLKKLKEEFEQEEQSIE